MAKIIRGRTRTIEFEYFVFYQRIGKKNDGYQFPSDKDGNLKPLGSCAQNSLARCMNSVGTTFEPPRIIEHQRPVTEHAILKCDCREEVELADPMTNKCVCGRFYNGCGQLLADPSQWGEETGERFDSEGREVL